MMKTLNEINEKELYDFLIYKKFNDFSLFLNEFLLHISYDAKINSLIKINQLIVKKHEYGVKFFFEIENPTSKKYTHDDREINYLNEQFENFIHFNKPIVHDYCINTNYNELDISFHPLW